MQNISSDKTKILLDLTDLAQSLIIGGLKKQEPELLVIGKTLLAAIGAVETEEGIQLLESMIKEYSARANEPVQKKEEDSLSSMLAGLGISLN
jgi:hypothetical protein